MEGDPRFEIKRIKGTLKSFDPKPGQSHALIRISDTEVLHVPTSQRGVAQPDGTIAYCQNGDRYDRIASGAPIELDVTYNKDGQKPVAKAWAPAVCNGRGCKKP